MASLFPVIIRTINSLTTKLSIGTVFKCVVLSLAAFVLLAVALYFLLASTVLASGWLESALDWLLGIGGTLLATWILFPVLMPIIAGLFLDGYLEKLSMREYQTPLRSVPLTEELPQIIWVVVQLVVINLLLLPFYFIPIIGQILYFSVNGYLLAKEFWLMICARMMLDQKSLHSRRSTLIISGVLLVLCAGVPFLNLAAPLVAATFMLHLGQDALSNGYVRARDGDIRIVRNSTPQSQEIE